MLGRLTFYIIFSIFTSISLFSQVIPVDPLSSSFEHRLLPSVSASAGLPGVQKMAQSGYVPVPVSIATAVFDMVKKGDKIYVASTGAIGEFSFSESEPEKGIYVVRQYMPQLIRGMDYNYVVSAEVDLSGNLWFGLYDFRSFPYEKGQLVRWDGNYGWRFYTLENAPFPARGIRSLRADSKGGLWVGTINGVVYFDGNRWITFDSLNSFLRGLPYDGKRVIDIEVDSDGNVWFGTWGGGVVRYDGVNMVAYNQDGMNFVTGIEIDGFGRIWVSCFAEYDENSEQYVGGGLFVYDEGVWKQIIPPVSRNLFTLSIDRDNIIWVSFYDWHHLTFKGVGKFDYARNRWEFFNTENSGLYSNAVSKILVDENNRKIFGHYLGGLKLSVFDGSSWSQMKIFIDPFMYNKTIIDREGRRWVWDNEGFAMIEPEISRFKYKIWESPYALNSGLPGDYFCVDLDGNIWAIAGTRVVSFDWNSWHVFDFDTSEYKPTYKIKVDRKNNKWIFVARVTGDLYYYGFLKYDNRQFKLFTFPDSVTYPYVNFGFEVDTSGNIWLSEKLGILTYLSGEDGSMLKRYEIDSIFVIGVDRDNNIWFSGGNLKVVKFNGVEWKSYDIPVSNAADGFWESAVSFAEAPDGSIWFGTVAMGIVGRIIKFQDGQLIPFSGMLNGAIVSINIDQEGNIWLTSEAAGQWVYLRDTYVGVGNREENVSYLPVYFKLYQNYPNPFNPETVIEFELPERVNVKLVVYDVLGREVGVLVDGELGAGRYKVRFDGRDLSSGIYFYELRAGKFRDVKKMVVVK